MEKVNDAETAASPSLLHDFKQADQSLYSMKQLIIYIGAVVLLGIGSGFMLSKITAKNSAGGNAATKTGNSSSISKGTVVGSNDLATFKDTAQGILQSGGINGEGQYHLVRPGGDSQNVYLFSAAVDLSAFVNKKIKVWGQTQTAKTAGWLMDVGRVEVLE